MDTKLSKAQLFKIIQSWEFNRALSGKLAGSLMKLAAPFAKNVLALSATMASASAIDVPIQ